MILQENRSFWQTIPIFGKPVSKSCIFGQNLVDFDCFTESFLRENCTFKLYRTTFTENHPPPVTSYKLGSHAG